jgi:hypothetical protein
MAQNVSPLSFLLSTFSISLCTRMVQSAFVPHVTFQVQKLLGEMEKCGKAKTPGRHVFCNLQYLFEISNILFQPLLLVFLFISEGNRGRGTLN